VTGAIIVLLTALVVSYRQVIEAFPQWRRRVRGVKGAPGHPASLVAAASLIVDYVLNAAVGVSAGIEALTSAFPGLYGGLGRLCLGTLAIITGLNLWGVSESAKVFTVPTMAFIAAMVAVIFGGLFRAHPAVVLDTHFGASTEAVGILLVLKAFASGCSALTGVKAIANSVPEFRKPRARRAQHTEVWLGILLGATLIGLGIPIEKFHVVPHSSITVLAQLTEASLGHNVIFYAIQLITMVRLPIPRSAACRCWPPCWPRTTSCRTCSGCARTARCTATAWSCWPSWPPLCWSRPMAIPRRWSRCSPSGCSSGSRCPSSAWSSTGERNGPKSWLTRAVINGVGAVLTAATTVIELISKFTEGAWLIVLVIPALVLMFDRVHRLYDKIGKALQLGQTPMPPAKHKSMVVVPVASLSRLTAAASRPRSRSATRSSR
jgi:hypothetical protein